jgi:hypothetical protein
VDLRRDFSFCRLYWWTVCLYYLSFCRLHWWTVCLYYLSFCRLHWWTVDVTFLSVDCWWPVYRRYFYVCFLFWWTVDVTFLSADCTGGLFVDVTFLSIGCTRYCNSDWLNDFCNFACKSKALSEVFISFMILCILLLDVLTVFHTLSVFLVLSIWYLVFPLVYARYALFSLRMRTAGVLNKAVKALMMIYTTYKVDCVICICSSDQVAVLQTVINDREKHAKHSQALDAVCKGIAVRGRNWGKVTIKLLLNQTKT